MGMSEADVGDEEVKVQGKGATAGAMPETDVVRVEVRIHGEEATVRAVPEADIVEDQEVEV